ncbi:MAG TPA: M3 family metallopeptidase, partial [Candidatus Acidoferrum sp.]
MEPAIADLMADARIELDRLTSETESRTFANTMVRLDHLTERLEYAMQIIRNLEALATTPELRAANNAVQPLVSEFYSSLPLNEALWQAVLGYSRTEEAQSLSGVRKRFLEKTMDNFRRHGAELDAAGKKRIAEIDVDLTKQTIRFAENVLDSTNHYEWVITDERKLAGLPESARAMARSSAASKGLPEPSWRFTLQGPSYLAVLTYLDDPELRQKVYEAFIHRATEEKYDNRPILRRILELRREKARLLGYRDFADLVLEDRMARKGERAQQFLNDLKHKTDPQFHQENAGLLAFSGKQKLFPWDVGYYAEKQRAALYDFDEEALRLYFPLDRVLSGMFEIVHRLYGIRVVEKEGVPGWDPQVKFYEIYDHGYPGRSRMIGAFYADWFPRENKRGGAWMDVFITGLPRGDQADPHLGLVCGNLTPPTEDRPSLLNHREVQTIFH